MKKVLNLITILLIFLAGISQDTLVEWRRLPIEAVKVPPDKIPSFYQLLCSPGGSIILSSTQGLIEFTGFRVNFPSESIMANEKVPMEKINDPHTEDGIKMMCKGKGSIFFFVTKSGKLYQADMNLVAATGWYNPPLYIPMYTSKEKMITAIWADEKGDLFVGVKGDSMLLFPGIANQLPNDGKWDVNGNFISKTSTKGVKKFFVEENSEISRFANDITNPGFVLLATSTGLIRFDKEKSTMTRIGPKWEKDIIVTQLVPEKNGTIWFSTLQYGMGMFTPLQNEYSFFKGQDETLSINTFLKKSENEFFIAVADSFPAVFNTTTKAYEFMEDSVFKLSKNITTEIEADGFGNVFIIKGGSLFYSQSFPSINDFSGFKLEDRAYAPFIYEMQINHQPYIEVARKAGMLYDMSEIRLKYNQNQLEFTCSLHEYWNQRNTIISWKLDGLNMDWVDMPVAGPDKFKAKFIPPLLPGKYVFRVRAKTGDGDWRQQEASLIIIIEKPFWGTWWFWTLTGFILFLIFLFFYRRHIISVRKQEREKVVHEKELVELEAKALRAQMNPHFVFNSLNSIKSLINKNENEKAAGYLSTFSKLIRTLFQNSDKREVSLYEEIETCKLYVQLEKMRFGDKVEFIFDIDESIDLKDFKVPALILQPFIENAIWHGLIPKEAGGKVTIKVIRADGAIQCIIDDDGIGREQSKQFKPQHEKTHQSKGIGLTQSRLELDKLLNEREDSIFIIDKGDEYGNPGGTKVIITFKEKES